MAGNQMHIFFGDAENICKQITLAKHALAWRIQSKALCLLVIACERRARLKRIHNNTIVMNWQAHNMRSLCKSGCNLIALTIMIIENDVPRRILIKQWRAFTRCIIDIHKSRQNINIEHHRFSGVAGLLFCFGNDKRNRITNKADLIGWQGRALWHQHFAAIAPRHFDHAFQRAILIEIVTGIDSNDTGHTARGFNIDAANSAVRVRATNEMRIELAIGIHIIGVTPLTAH